MTRDTVCGTFEYCMVYLAQYVSWQSGLTEATCTCYLASSVESIPAASTTKRNLVLPKRPTQTTTCSSRSQIGAMLLGATLNKDEKQAEIQYSLILWQYSIAPYIKCSLWWIQNWQCLWLAYTKCYKYISLLYLWSMHCVCRSAQTLAAIRIHVSWYQVQSVVLVPAVSQTVSSRRTVPRAEKRAQSVTLRNTAVEIVQTAPEICLFKISHHVWTVHPTASLDNVRLGRASASITLIKVYTCI